MEFINSKFLSVEPVFQTLHHLTSTDSTIKPITVEWQKEKYGLLGIRYDRPIDQHSTLSGRNCKSMSPGFVMILAPTATAYLDAYLTLRTIMQRFEGIYRDTC